MRRLLRANFSRLWKNRLFWLCMGSMLICSVVYMLTACRKEMADASEYQSHIDQYYFYFALLIGFFCMLLGSMFFGTEYSDGTIRNKIIAGHTRANIYLAEFITTFAATLLILSAWLVGALVAVPVLGFWKMGIPRLLLYLLISILFILAYSAVSTPVNMLSSNKAVTVIVSVLLFLGMLVFTSMLYNALGEPEMISGVQITRDGMEMAEPSPNPNYITGMKRDIYDFIVDFLPTGQGLRMWQLEIAHPVRMLASSALLSAVCTFLGIACFEKKDIK